MCLFMVVLTSGCECAGRIVKQNACVFIVEHCDITPSLRRYRSDESCCCKHRLMANVLPERAVSDGVSRSKQLLFNK
jgi:hypothetical protein